MEGMVMYALISALLPAAVVLVTTWTVSHMYDSPTGTKRTSWEKWPDPREENKE